MSQAGRTSERGVRASVAVAASALLLTLELVFGLIALPLRSRPQTTPRGTLKPDRVHLSAKDPIATKEPETTDRFADGTPDFLRLDDSAHREDFRRWITLLAEVKSAQATEKLQQKITCLPGLRHFAC